MSDAHTPSADPYEALSFTIDDDGNVLELIKDDENGIYYRDLGEWVSLGDDEPTSIYERDIIEVDPEHADQALKFWDENGAVEADIDADQVQPFSRMYQ